MQPTLAIVRPNDYSDLLDIAPANDVEARRPQLRAVAGWSLTATLSDESEDNLYAGLDYDVEHGGVFVATYDAPPVGARVDVTLTLPDGRALVVGGVVRWIRDAELATDGLPAGCAVEWKGLPVDAVRDLEAFAAAVREPMLYLPDAAA